MLSLFGGVSHYLSRAPKYRFMISTIRLADNNDTEARDNICKVAIFWVVMVSGENFKVRAPKCSADYKQSKAR